MTYRSLERANAYFYDPERRLAVVKRHGGVSYLSSGVNHLKAPEVLLDLAGREFKERRLIENYSAPSGALGIGAAISFELHERLGRSAFGAIGPANICLTVGATGALAGAFRYLAEVTGARTALVLGLNYSFFSTICDSLGIRYRILRSEERGRLLPSVAEVRHRISTERPAIVVLSQPTNPSGELFTAHELQQVVEMAEEFGCWLVFDEVPSLAAPDEGDLPAPFPAGAVTFVSPRLIWINSYSKSRSLAGLRAGYMVAAPTVVDFVRKYNERLLWSPVNAGSSALIADMVLRAVLRALGKCEAGQEARTISRTVKRAGHYLQAFAPYSDDFSRLDGIWRFLDGALDWPDACASYGRDLARVGEICRANWQMFSSDLAPHITEAIHLKSGFNHCVKLDAAMSEWEFVVSAYDQAGIDFYTETVFADHDDADTHDFWIRISCAVEPDMFSCGVRNLAAVLDARSARH
ncbi:MAG: pyridoxal phosphate-dependent aminotransferase [Hyphomicrobiales bacterium]|nr:pyridoxal phosphate-dependent aminotransferase [Hyphomicrobiales bacterium]MBV8825969.1 pyridoxal phosphate-dependent aminotransferase [Hyphomicrobiales bacterium]MBV9428544.1 pyridoxal phosphate-dependent aminotransferase [Bradyrhizobiaceae bacterium]